MALKGVKMMEDCLNSVFLTISWYLCNIALKVAGAAAEPEFNSYVIVTIYSKAIVRPKFGGKWSSFRSKMKGELDSLACPDKT